MTEPISTTVEEFALPARPGASIHARVSSHVGPIIPALLLFATLITTSMMGARFALNFENSLPPLSAATSLLPLAWIAQDPWRLLMGLPFSLTVLSILMAHELGHYFACRRHGVEATLPYFLPAPTLSGTAGAIIKLRSRVQNRRALLDIGASGPLWGFAVAAPATVLGLLLSKSSLPDAPPQVMALNTPLMFLLNGIIRHTHPGWPTLANLQPHPVLLGAWIGLFVTFLNLLPAGQLDGGHILYAIAPRIHRTVSNIVAFTLLLAGIFFWLGWLLWGMVLVMPFMRHPRIAADPEPDRDDYWLAISALALLVLTALPIPFYGSSVVTLIR